MTEEKKAELAFLEQKRKEEKQKIKRYKFMLESATARLKEIEKKINEI